MDPATRDRIEAAAFRRLTRLLRGRTDVQNVDLMGTGGFCRNCLSEWIEAAARAEGVPLDRDAARAWVYGMPYNAYKAAYQAEATPDQLARMADSVAKNRALDAVVEDTFPASDPPAVVSPS